MKVTICEIISFRRNPLERVLFMGSETSSPATPKHIHLRISGIPRGLWLAGPLMVGAHKSNFEKQITPLHILCVYRYGYIYLCGQPYNYSLKIYTYNPFSVTSDNLCMASVSDICVFALHPRPLLVAVYEYNRTDCPCKNHYCIILIRSVARNLYRTYCGACV